MSLISVITLTHNKLACTRRCLPSLLKSTGARWELIVVENGSTDGTAHWLRGFRRDAEAAGVRTTILSNAPPGTGCSTARNRGIAAASGEKIVFVDNDVAVRSRGWLALLDAVLDHDPGAAAVGPKLVYPFPPYRIQFAGGGVSRGGRILFAGRGEPGDEPRFNVRRDVQHLISACLMIRAAALKAAGGFDEAFNPVQFEDTDLCYRVRSMGHRILYEPSVEMYHFESVTTAGTPGMNNASLVVRHGLLFKERWRHMFEHENGPAEEETRWRRVEVPPLDEIADPPLV
jgi:GT2 family glycosyltransferase